VVFCASALEGVKVAVVSALLKLTDPATALPPKSFTVNDTLLGTTASENVAVAAAVTGLPDDPAPGVEPVTADGVVITDTLLL
jgi:hypothetical protein